MLSSIGYHTLSLYKKITIKEARILYKDFSKYNEVYIIPGKRNKGVSDMGYSPLCLINNYYDIKYRKYKGISWMLRISLSSPGFRDKTDDEHKSCSVRITINPKIFTEIIDFVAAASEEHLREVETNFNLEANKISPILGDFDSFLIQRIDYCFNFDVKELELNCTPEQLMTLIKRSNIPAHFEEWQEYDDVPIE